MKRLALAVIACSCLNPTAIRAQAPAELTWHRSQLPSGLRLIVIHAPNAKRQVTFSFLPTHLGNDDADRAQWSHLLEHMLIRTTDAEGLQAGGITFNGETTDTYLRLETMAVPSEWRQAIDRHAKWLTPTAFDPQRLENEKKMIAGEERGTAIGGHTGKFAIAAWNQVVIHGRETAQVHGDVQNAKIEDVLAYAKSRVALDDSALLATIGPTPMAEMEAEITRLLGTAKPSKRTEAGAFEILPEGKSFNATWDLPTRHVMAWWRLPNDNPKTIAAATGFARGLFLQMHQRRDLAPSIKTMTPHAAVRTSRGTFLIFNACLARDAKADDVLNAMRESAAKLASGDANAKQTIAMAARMASNEMMLEPKFDMLAAQVPPQLRDSVEGLWLLGLLNFEFAWGVPAEQVQSLLTTLDDDAIASIAAIMKQPPSTLVLMPQAAPLP